MFPQCPEAPKLSPSPKHLHSDSAHGQAGPLSPSPVPTECGAGHVDLVMVIDGSKSVRPQNFELVKQFVNRIVDLLEVSPHGTRVGLVQYSSRVRTEFPLNKYHSADEIKKAVMDVEYMEKGTMTGLALKHMVEHSFSELEGARPLSQNIPRIGLVFTDGRSQDDISEWARRAKESGAGGLRNPKLQCFGHPGMVPWGGCLRRSCSIQPWGAASQGRHALL